MEKNKWKVIRVVCTLIVISGLIFIIGYLRVFPFFIDRINVYDAKDFKADQAHLIVSLKDDSKQTIVSSINFSRRNLGKMDIRYQDYVVNVLYKGGTVKTYFLWLGSKGESGLWMKSTDTGTGYTISLKNTEKLIEIIQNN